MIGTNIRSLLGNRVIGGTWTVSGTWTIPAITLGGVVTGNGQIITDIAGLELRSTSLIYNSVSNTYTGIRGGLNVAGGGGEFIASGVDAANAGQVEIITPNAAGDAGITRFKTSGKTAIALVTWASATHEGIVLSGALDFAGNHGSFTEMSAPGAGAANTARIYALEGAGDQLTDLCAVFQDSTVVVFAEEATPLDSPILTQPSQTEVKVFQMKPHPGLIEILIKYPDGKTFPLKKIEYHDADKIAANTGCDAPLPKDWFVETASKREARLEAEEAERLTQMVS